MFYHLGQELAKGHFGLKVMLPPANLAITYGGGLTLLHFKAESQAENL